jgi:hypothetical protein
MDLVAVIGVQTKLQPVLAKTPENQPSVNSVSRTLTLVAREMLRGQLHSQGIEDHEGAAMRPVPGSPRAGGRVRNIAPAVSIPAATALGGGAASSAAQKLHTLVLTHVKIVRSSVASDPFRSGEWLDFGPAQTKMSAGISSAGLRFMTSAGNFTVAEAQQGQSVNRKRMPRRLDVLKTQVYDFGMLARSDICCQKQP